MSRKIIFVIIGIFILLIVFLCYEGRKEPICQKICLPDNVMKIGKIFHLYAIQHDGAFPPNLLTLLSPPYCAPLEIFWTKRHLKLTSIEDSIDYIYIYWPTGMKTPKNYPLMYSRRLSDFEGKIFIIFVNVVHDYRLSNPDNAFWDKNAEWLQKFAREHPQFKIPMPEDLKIHQK